MSKNLGIISPGATAYCRFNTFDLDGYAITFIGGALAAYKNNSATPSTAGLSLTTDLNSVVGLHRVTIDTTDAFYEGGNYSIVLSAGTVDGVSVAGTVVAEFTIGTVGFSLDEENLQAISMAAKALHVGDWVYNESSVQWNISGLPAYMLDELLGEYCLLYDASANEYHENRIVDFSAGLMEFGTAIQFTGAAGDKILILPPDSVKDTIATAVGNGSYGNAAIKEALDSLDEKLDSLDEKVDEIEIGGGGGGGGGGATLLASISSASLNPAKFLEVVQGEEKTITFIVVGVGGFDKAAPDFVSAKFQDSKGNIVYVDGEDIIQVTNEPDLQVIRVPLVEENTKILVSGLLRIELTFDTKKAILTHSMKVLEGIPNEEE